MPWDTLIWVFGVTAEFLLVALLAYKREYRRIPVFFTYIVWGFAGDIAMRYIGSSFPHQLLRAYLIQLVIDSALQYCVLVELAWCILRPVRTAVPRRLVFVIALIILVAGALAWPFATVQDIAGLSADSIRILRIQQSFAILRILLFAALSAGSHLLSIGWRNREFQIATGLGFYSLVSLSASVIHNHQSSASPGFHIVDELVAASYLASLVYWLVSFVQKEPPRRDLPPNIQNILGSLAGQAQRHREKLNEPPPD